MSLSTECEVQGAVVDGEGGDGRNFFLFPTHLQSLGKAQYDRKMDR